jgi:uncharacterized protein
VKVYIRQIRSEGSTFQETFPVETMGHSPDGTVRLTAPAAVEAKVFHMGDEVLAEMTVQSAYASFCGRCLEEVERGWTGKIKLVFDIDKTLEFIDMDEDIRQEVMISLPASILCRPDCKGLCRDCGMNLNKEQCRHIGSEKIQNIIR